MPTSKIENREEAAQAFMEGAYFKVGDFFISPDEIVTAYEDAQGNPTFELTDGRTVKHNEFTDGSTGHFLFEQLRKVEGRYVETRKPPFNLVYNQSGKLFTPSGDLVANFNNLYDGFIEPGNKVIVGRYSGNIRVFDFGGNKLHDYAPASSKTENLFVYPAPNGKVIQFSTNTSPLLDIYESNLDGTGATAIKTGISVADDRLTDAAVSSDRIVWLISSAGDGTYSMERTGGAVSTYSQTDVFDGIDLRPAEEKVLIENSDFSNGGLYSFDYNLSNKQQIYAWDYGTSRELGTWNEEAGEYIQVIRGGDVVGYNLNGDIQTEYFSRPNGFEVDVALDLSRL